MRLFKSTSLYLILRKNLNFKWNKFWIYEQRVILLFIRILSVNNCNIIWKYFICSWLLPYELHYNLIKDIWTRIQILAKQNFQHCNKNTMKNFKYYFIIFIRRFVFGNSCFFLKFWLHSMFKNFVIHNFIFDICTKAHVHIFFNFWLLSKQNYENKIT